ncbi:MAG TPA: Spy/CpxP family protein refolding chaperone [Burkholderiales bacterium]|nr:Spy/CpxP family protein refolding chaperone [Burkholderiales bacterium]
MNKLTAMLVTIGFAVAAPLAMAQDMPDKDGASWHQSQRGHHEKRPFSTPGERIEAKLAYLKTALRITPAQQPQWDAFANAMRAQAREQDKRIQEWRAQRDQNDGERGRPTAVERLERRERFYSVALDDLKQRIAVEKPLYAALTPEQQQIADEVFAAHGGHRGFGHGMRHKV